LISAKILHVAQEPSARIAGDHTDAHVLKD
jgi:hypothetical protein